MRTCSAIAVAALAAAVFGTAPAGALDGTPSPDQFNGKAQPAVAAAPTSPGDAYRSATEALKSGETSRAVLSLQYAAEHGHGFALWRLGRMYAEGEDYAFGAVASENPAEAADWFRKAAEQGLGGAQIALGDLYFEGKGVAMDEAEAARWYLKAEPNWLNPTRLGILYEDGRGVKQDLDRARDLYKRGAAWHYPDAAYRLGRLYEVGRGVPQNLDQAARWYDLAAKRGYIAAREALERLIALRDKPGDRQ